MAKLKDLDWQAKSILSEIKRLRMCWVTVMRKRAKVMMEAAEG